VHWIAVPSKLRAERGELLSHDLRDRAIQQMRVRKPQTSTWTRWLILKQVPFAMLEIILAHHMPFASALGKKNSLSKLNEATRMSLEKTRSAPNVLRARGLSAVGHHV